jgi:dihydroorotate dehydrogenase electron transfer subunit
LATAPPAEGTDADARGKKPIPGVHAERPRVLLIGEGAGIARMIAAAEQLREQANPASAAQSEAVEAGGRWKPLVLLGSQTPFPFRTRPSIIIVPGIPGSTIACMPLLEEWGIASRLASTSDFPGCFEGPVSALADVWLASLGAGELAEVELFACGPAAMLEEAAAIASRHGVPCQGLPVEIATLE